MGRATRIIFGASVLIAAPVGVVLSHDPVFGIGPHVLFRDGLEISSVVAKEKAGLEKESELALELAYGITGVWSAGTQYPVPSTQYELRVDGLARPCTA